MAVSPASVLGANGMIEHYFGANLPYYIGFLAVVVACVVFIYFSLRNSK
jgi:hypothetical protein